MTVGVGVEPTAVATTGAVTNDRVLDHESAQRADKHSPSPSRARGLHRPIVVGMTVLKGDIQEGQARILANEHTASSFRNNAKAVVGESIYKGQAHNVHVFDTICYGEVPVTRQEPNIVSNGYRVRAEAYCSSEFPCRRWLLLENQVLYHIHVASQIHYDTSRNAPAPHQHNLTQHTNTHTKHLRSQW